MKRILNFLCVALAASRLADAAVEEGAIRAAIEKSLALIERSSMIAIEERPNCFTCHHTGLPLMTLIGARDRGFEVNLENIRTQLRFTADFLAKNRANYLVGKGQGGQAFTAGSALWALKLGAWKPDPTTEAVVEYLLTHQKELDFWKPPSIRPPAEESPFSTSFVALEAVRHFGTAVQRARVDRRVAQVHSWLVQTPGTSTEDRVFRLWALHAASVDRAATRPAAQALLDLQRAGGGWAQLDDMSPDAYATATALVALHRTGSLSTGDPAFQNGLRWLLKAQLPDGSWHVRTRSKPIQKHFESGYPHGKDQFISITAACWATAALIAALPGAE